MDKKTVEQNRKQSLEYQVLILGVKKLIDDFLKKNYEEHQKMDRR